MYGQNDVGFDDAQFQYSSALVDYAEEINPTYIAFAADQSDVQKIINFVINCDDIEYISIQSIGHQYSGTLSCNQQN